MSTLVLVTVVWTLFTVVVGKCPDGTTPGLGPYDCYLLGNATGNWQVAEDACEAANGFLAAASNAFANRFLASKAGPDGFWLGAYPINGPDAPKGYLWRDLSDFSYTNWAKGEPRVTYDYIHLQANGQWKTVDQFDEKPYICKVSPVFSDLPPQSNGSGRSSSLCPEGWKHLRKAGKCAKAFNTKKPWFDALAQCRAFGGDLLKVTNESVEREMSVMLIPPDDFPLDGYAIGIYSPVYPNAAKDTSWQWTLTDGSAAAYTFFDSFVGPMSGHGHCVYADAHTTDWGTGYDVWFNAFCVGQNGFICELPTYTAIGSD